MIIYCVESYGDAGDCGAGVYYPTKAEALKNAGDFEVTKVWIGRATRKELCNVANHNLHHYEVETIGKARDAKLVDYFGNIDELGDDD